MTTSIKKLIGDAGAGIDQSHGTDRLYDVLIAIATDQAAIIASLNQLLTDYNAETLADHTTSTASAVTATITIE